jgi:oligoribonuclease
MVDVSTIKELVRRWYPPPFHAPKKREVHRALDDIRESIAELTWYRQRVFHPPVTLGGAETPRNPPVTLGGAETPPNPPGAPKSA